MEFRPCIDIHNGKVKQIVGSSLRDQGDTAKEISLRTVMPRFMRISTKRTGSVAGTSFC